MKKKISEKEAEKIFFEESNEYTLVENEGWEDEGKCSYGSKIFKDSNGLFWRICCSRCCSPSTVLEHSVETELQQVKQVEVVKKEWKEA